MQPHYWKTDEPHFDNNVTMAEYLNEIMDEEWSVIILDGTYAEVKTTDGRKFEIHASGDGDSFNHKVEFVELSA